jgi:aspartate/methionine/tyrosine aminotransferase
VSIEQAAGFWIHPAVANTQFALQRHFRVKRDYAIFRLEEMGLPTHVPDATFYIWVDLSGLAPPLNDGLVFFEELLKEKAICVPGIAFDIDPAARRNLYDSPCHHFIRLSYGPKIENLKIGLDAMERVLKKRETAQHLLGKE